MRGHKVGESGVQDVVARQEAMALVNRYALRELRPDEVAIYEAEACNELVDRDAEAFSREILEDFRVTLPGKSLLASHDWGSVAVGRVIAARLDDDAGYWSLKATFFLLRATDAPLIAKVDGGVAWAVSIGFMAPARVMTPLEDGMVGVYERGPSGERGEALELSLVFLGAQWNAQVLSAKAAGRKHAGCGRAEATCQAERDVLQRELWAVKSLQDRARFDRPGLPRRIDLNLVELDRKRVELTERLSSSCGGM